MSEQIDRLARFIMESVEGEPSQSEGAGDTAIRAIQDLQAKLTRYEEVVDAIKERCREFATPPILGADVTDQELGFFEGHRLAHRQINELLAALDKQEDRPIKFVGSAS